MIEKTYCNMEHPWSSDGLTLSDDTANNMVENCIGTMGLPLSLALNIKVNGELLNVPMAGEEPSVVAAVSNRTTY